jgi:hypothetical protein
MNNNFLLKPCGSVNKKETESRLVIWSKQWSVCAKFIWHSQIQERLGCCGPVLATWAFTNSIERIVPFDFIHRLVWTCVLWSFVYNFQFLNFVCSWDTRRRIKSKSTIRSILIHHCQNPTSPTAFKLNLVLGICLTNCQTYVILIRMGPREDNITINLREMGWEDVDWIIWLRTGASSGL